MMRKKFLSRDMRVHECLHDAEGDGGVVAVAPGVAHQDGAVVVRLENTVALVGDVAHLCDELGDAADLGEVALTTAGSGLL